MWSKGIIVAVMTVVLSMAQMGTPVLANAGDAFVETTQEQTSQTGTTVAESEKQSGSALTPEGNLSLVDDGANLTGVGKQFITVVTKDGNYFYLIIDRDAYGKEIVHFLNQVDESDLLRLLEDKEAQEYLDAKEETEAEMTVSVESEPADTEEPEAVPMNLWVMIGAILALGIAAIVLILRLGQKEDMNSYETPERPRERDDQAIQLLDDLDMDVSELDWEEDDEWN